MNSGGAMQQINRHRVPPPSAQPLALPLHYTHDFQLGLYTYTVKERTSC